MRILLVYQTKIQIEIDHLSSMHVEQLCLNVRTYSFAFGVTYRPSNEARKIRRIPILHLSKLHTRMRDLNINLLNVSSSTSRQFHNVTASVHLHQVFF